jgi:hypothetical protein
MLCTGINLVRQSAHSLSDINQTNLVRSPAKSVKFEQKISKHYPETKV